MAHRFQGKSKPSEDKWRFLVFLNIYLKTRCPSGSPLLFSYSYCLFWGNLAIFCPQTPKLSGWVLSNNSSWFQKEFVELKDCRIWQSTGLTPLQWVKLAAHKECMNVQCVVLCSFQIKGWFLRFWQQLVLEAFPPQVSVFNILIQGLEVSWHCWCWHCDEGLPCPPATILALVTCD